MIRLADIILNIDQTLGKHLDQKFKKMVPANLYQNIMWLNMIFLIISTTNYHFLARKRNTTSKIQQQTYVYIFPIKSFQNVKLSVFRFCLGIFPYTTHRFTSVFLSARASNIDRDLINLLKHIFWLELQSHAVRRNLKRVLQNTLWAAHQ